MKINVKNILISSIVCATLVGCNSEELAATISVGGDAGSNPIESVSNSPLAGNWISSKAFEGNMVALQFEKSELSGDEFHALPACTFTEEEMHQNGTHEMHMFIAINHDLIGDMYTFAKNIEDGSRCLIKEDLGDQLTYDAETGKAIGSQDEPGEYVLLSFPNENTMIVRNQEIHGHWIRHYQVEQLEDGRTAYHFEAVASADAFPKCNTEEAGFSTINRKYGELKNEILTSFTISNKYERRAIVREVASDKRCFSFRYYGDLDYEYDQENKTLNVNHTSDRDVIWTDKDNFKLIY